MDTPFSADRYAALLERLLAPTWRERKAADTLLWMLIMHQEPDAKGRWSGELGHATDKLSGDPNPFLAALISFWADRSLVDTQARIAGLGFDPSLLMPVEDFQQQVSELMHRIKDTPRQPGVDAIRIPSELFASASNGGLKASS